MSEDFFNGGVFRLNQSHKIISRIYRTRTISTLTQTFHVKVRFTFFSLPIIEDRVMDGRGLMVGSLDCCVYTGIGQFASCCCVAYITWRSLVYSHPLLSFGLKPLQFATLNSPIGTSTLQSFTSLDSTSCVFIPMKISLVPCFSCWKIFHPITMQCSTCQIRWGTQYPAMGVIEIDHVDASPRPTCMHYVGGELQ